MKKLSIEEFKLLCDKLSPKEFIINSENYLNLDIPENGLKYTLVFPRIVISNPNTICFMDNDKYYIEFNRIKYIEQQEDSLLGKVFSIVCTGFIDEEKEYLHTIIMR